MPIIGTLPFIILDGQLVDAPPVMADFNFIISQVNANVPALIPAANNSIITVASVGGTANAVTLTPSPAVSAYAALLRLQYINPGTNTGAMTVNVSGLGVKSILWPDGSPMSGGEFISGDPGDICYNGTAFIPMMNPGPLGIQTTNASVTFGGASTGITYSSRVITYMKIGRVVYFTVDVILTSKGSATGTMLVTGLPYAVNASWGAAVNQVGAGCWTSNVTFTNGFLAPYLAAGSSSIGVLNTPSGGGAASFLTDANFANNSEVVLSGTYIV